MYELKLGPSLYLFWCVLDKGKKKLEFCFVFLLAKLFWFLCLKYIYANNLFQSYILIVDLFDCIFVTK